MTAFTVTDLPLPGLKLIERRCLGDHRGFLSRLFCATELVAVGWGKPIAQLNHTFTAKCGTVRGLHFQRPPSAEMKLVNCIHGELWDVAVDLRPDSPTFLQVHTERLSANNRRALFIPEGFAHGFQTLSDDVELLYCHSAAYDSIAEAGLHPEDPKLKIQWPLKISELSARDSSHPLLDEQYAGVVL